MLLCKRVTLVHLCLRGDVSDYVLMEGRGFGFVTFADPTHAQSFLEVCEESVGFMINYLAQSIGRRLVLLCRHVSMSLTARRLRPKQQSLVTPAVATHSQRRCLLVER